MSPRPTQSDAPGHLSSEVGIRQAVRVHYAARAPQVLAPVESVPPSTCCGGDCCSTTSCCDDPVTANLHTDGQAAEIPDAALRASLGRGNPTALIDLRPGQTVLDLGSGGGIDVILSARRVGETGKVFGVDMTDEMLALARRNAAEVGIDISGLTSQTLATYLEEPWDVAISVRDQARDACPVFPGARERLHWSFPDPSRVEGTVEERLTAFRTVRDAIGQRIVEFVRDRSG